MAESMTAQGLVLAWPWALVLLPLPWLLRRWLRPAPDAGTQALRVPWFGLMQDTAATWLKKPLLAAIATLAWLLLVVAAARPQWVGEIENLPVTGRDLLLAVDIIHRRIANCATCGKAIGALLITDIRPQQAGGIGEMDAVAQINLLGTGRNRRSVADSGDLSTGERVDQGRFADVGNADHHRPQGFTRHATVWHHSATQVGNLTDGRPL